MPRRVTIAELVRDGIPAIVSQDGLEPNWARLEPKDAARFQDAALIAKAAQWVAFHEEQQLADVVSLIDALARSNFGLSLGDIIRMADERDTYRGRYSTTFLGTVTVPEDEQ